MEITSDIRNDLFKRNEIKASLEAEKNPGFDEVRKMISEQTKKPEEGIDVYGIKGNFGSNSFVIKVNVYDSKEDKDKAKQLTQKQRKTAEEEAKKPKEEAKPEETATEVPAEEKKEEAKEEAPSEVPAEEKPEEEKKEKKEEEQIAEEAKE
jgi:ribosomal protein S24E|tara:strand:- start:52 stop:504 length:453 start_codon:yes stop_codon:yes gene_type:complete